MLNYSHSIMVLQEENVKQKSYFTPATKKKNKKVYTPKICIRLAERKLRNNQHPQLLLM